MKKNVKQEWLLAFWNKIQTLTGQENNIAQPKTDKWFI